MRQVYEARTLWSSLFCQMYIDVLKVLSKQVCVKLYHDDVNATQEGNCQLENSYKNPTSARESNVVIKGNVARLLFCNPGSGIVNKVRHNKIQQRLRNESIREKL